MKLLGKDFQPEQLLRRLEERLALRGLLERVQAGAGASGDSASGSLEEAPVNPLTFNLHALERHSDPTVGLPLETHRGGIGRVVITAKWMFRKTCQVFINETLGRQRIFNGHVRDSYAQLSAEVLQLREELEALKSRTPRRSAPKK